jgi:hypothetical protein
MLVENGGSQITVPDFMIVGAPRCGTSALYTYLSRHPRIFMPIEKEPMFFSAWRRKPFIEIREPHRPLDWVVSSPEDYLALFRPAKKNQILGEASTWYLYDYQHAISNILSLYGDRHKEIKIIILLRNPADRAWSHYLNQVSMRRESMDFESAIQPEVVFSRLKKKYPLTYDYIGFGCYFSQVKAYLNQFDKVRVAVFEEFFRETGASLSSVYDFLGVRPPVHQVKLNKVNMSGRPKGPVSTSALNLIFRPNLIKTAIKPFFPHRFRAQIKYKLKNALVRREKLDPELRQRLLENYLEDCSKLEQLLNRDLSLWFEEKEKGGDSSILHHSRTPRHL